MIKRQFIYSILLFSLLFTSLFTAAQNSFQLAPPQMKFSSIFFSESTSISLFFAQPDANIHYTTNGDEPTLTDRIYIKPIIITKNLTTIKAKSFSKEFLPSATVSTTFIKDGLKFDAIFPLANSQYKGDGPNTLTNNLGGIADHTLKQWLGYKEDSVTIFLSLKKEETLKSVVFNAMQNQDSWIFSPSKVEAFVFDSRQKEFIKIAQTAYQSQKNEDDMSCKPFLLNLNNTSTKELKLVFHNQRLPVWHSAKGNNSWIFIDEIKLY